VNRPRLAVAVQKTLRGPGLPAAADIRRWVRAAADGAAGEITVRIVGSAESAALNARYRDRQGATNVLAFAAEVDDVGSLEGELPPLGDLVVCAPVIEREAREQGKALEAHWAHIVIHGTLHLVGYDHGNDSDASVMEDRERDLLADFGIDDPYCVDRQ
jgi:probable rRNA maturation factor